MLPIQYTKITQDIQYKIFNKSVITIVIIMYYLYLFKINNKGCGYVDKNEKNQLRALYMNVIKAPRNRDGARIRC